MQLRTLGRSNLRIAPLCLGGNVFGWTAAEAASFAVLDASVSAGLNLIDTADVYSKWAARGNRGGEVEAASSELQGTQEIDHCGADFVRSFLLRPVAAALEHDGTAQLRYEAR